MRGFETQHNLLKNSNRILAMVMIKVSVLLYGFWIRAKLSGYELWIRFQG